MLFSDQRRHSISIPAANKDGKPATIADLIHHLCEHTMKDARKDLFVLQDHLYVTTLTLLQSLFYPSIYNSRILMHYHLIKTHTWRAS